MLCYVQCCYCFILRFHLWLIYSPLLQPKHKWQQIWTRLHLLFALSNHKYFGFCWGWFEFPAWRAWWQRNWRSWFKKVEISSRNWFNQYSPKSQNWCKHSGTKWFENERCIFPTLVRQSSFRHGIPQKFGGFTSANVPWEEWRNNLSGETTPLLS